MEFKITKEQIESLDGVLKKGYYATAQVSLREWFPAAFEPEWEEVPLDTLFLWHKDNTLIDRTGESLFAFLSPNDYKIENGRIWRKKS